MVNLGATCYMNALIQQFYMLPTIRDGILSAKYHGQQPGADLLNELQRMFTYCMQSEKKSFDTRQFCNSFEMNPGEPLNVHVQQDVGEFFARFVDQIIVKLRNTPQQNLFDFQFGNITQVKYTHLSADSVRLVFGSAVI